MTFFYLYSFMLTVNIICLRWHFHNKMYLIVCTCNCYCNTTFQTSYIFYRYSTYPKHICIQYISNFLYIYEPHFQSQWFRVYFSIHTKYMSFAHSQDYFWAPTYKYIHQALKTLLFFLSNILSDGWFNMMERLYVHK